MNNRATVAVTVNVLLACACLGLGGYYAYRTMHRGAVIPQDPEYHAKLKEHHVQLAKAMYVDGFQKYGKRDPAWDEPANKAVQAASQFFSDVDDSPIPLTEVHSHAKAAIDAGCDDPLIIHIYARSSYGTNYPGHPEHDVRWTAAAKALADIEHHPRLRFATYVRACEARTNNKAAGTKRKTEAIEFLDQAANVLPEIMSIEPTPFDRKTWHENFRALKRRYEVSGLKTHEAYERLDQALAKAPKRRAQQLIQQANRCIDDGWNARGGGTVDTLTQKGISKFYSELTNARALLEEAWTLDALDSDCATSMLQIEVGIGTSRAEMEKWFTRAMQLDPDNELACRRKLSWLSPKWHGNERALLSFARACRDTENWKSGIPLLLAEAHHDLFCISGRHPIDASVADELIEVYESYLEHLPDDHTVRNEFAGMCYMCKRYDVAHREFVTLGDKLKPTQWFDKATIELARDVSAERVGALKKKDKK